MSSSQVVWNIHYGDNQKCKVKIRKGMSFGNIIANIKHIVAMNDILCFDQDQCIIALSSILPNGTDIYIKPRNQKANTQQQEEKKEATSNNTAIRPTKQPLIYGYADRAGAGSQNCAFDQGGTGAPIIFTNTTTNGCNNVGNLYNPSNGRFTAQIHGIYSFSVSAWLSNAKSSGTQLWYHYNGKRCQTFTGPIHEGVGVFTGSMIVEIKKNDYVDFRFYQASYKGTTQVIAENFHHTFVRWSLIQQIL